MDLVIVFVIDTKKKGGISTAFLNKLFNIFDG